MELHLLLAQVNEKRTVQLYIFKTKIVVGKKTKVLTRHKNLCPTTSFTTELSRTIQSETFIHKAAIPRTILLQRISDIFS